MAGITAISVVQNDAADLRLMLEHIRPHVDEILLVVQPSEDDTLAVAKHYADKVIEPETATLHIETYFADLIAQAANDIIVEIYPDERFNKPELLRALADEDADVWWFGRIDYLDDVRVQIFRDDRHPRMHRRGALKWTAKMHTYPEMLSQKQFDVREVWMEHRRSMERIRLRQTQYAKFAAEHGETDRIVPMQDAFLRRAEEVYSKVKSGRYPRKILLSYNGIVGIGDTLMTTPAVREIRRLYPQAEITYLTQQGVVLKNNPYIDVIDSTPVEKWKPENESKYDFVVHWEGSLTGQAGYRLNGYECESYWAYVEPESYHADWFVTKSEDKEAKNFLAQHVKTSRVVGMALSASCLHRTWQHSEEFVQALLREYEDVTLIFFGDAKCRLLEMEYSSYLQPVKDAYGVRRYAQLPYDGPGKDRIIRTSGTIDLRRVAAIIKNLDLLIAPDSGLMHVAAALDVPTVAYFNLVPPYLRVKHCPTVTPVAADYECSPCFVHGTIACDKTTKDGAPCLHTVTVDRVMKAVEEVLL